MPMFLMGKMTMLYTLFLWWRFWLL